MHQLLQLNATNQTPSSQQLSSQLPHQISSAFETSSASEPLSPYVPMADLSNISHSNVIELDKRTLHTVIKRMGYQASTAQNGNVVRVRAAKAILRLEQVLSSASLGLVPISDDFASDLKYDLEYDLRYSSEEFLLALCQALNISKKIYAPLLDELSTWAQLIRQKNFTPMPKVVAQLDIAANITLSFMKKAYLSKFTHVHLVTLTEYANHQDMSRHDHDLADGINSDDSPKNKINKRSYKKIETAEAQLAFKLMSRAEQLAVIQQSIRHHHQQHSNQLPSGVTIAGYRVNFFDTVDSFKEELKQESLEKENLKQDSLEKEELEKKSESEEIINDRNKRVEVTNSTSMTGTNSTPRHYYFSAEVI